MFYNILSYYRHFSVENRNFSTQNKQLTIQNVKVTEISILKYII